MWGVLIASAVAFISTVQDPDFWWHVRIGQWMVQNGRLPSHDLFTYTVPGNVWTDHEYVTEVLMYLAYRAGGAAAVSLGFGAVSWLGLYAVYRTCEPERRPYVIVGLVLLLAVLAGEPIWGPRAQMLEFSFTALLLYWLQGYLSGRSRAIVWFPLVMVVWANTHGSFVVAFAFLGAALAAEGARWALDRSSRVHRDRFWVLAAVFVASAAAMLVTPHGPGFVLYPLRTQGSAAQQLLIQEWLSPDFHAAYLRPFEAMLLVLVVGFAVRRPSLYELLVSLIAVALALESQRHIALFVAACTPVVVASWSAGWTQVARRLRPRLRGGKAPRGAAVVTAVALALIGVASAVKVASDLSTQARVTAASYPVGAATWLAAHPGVGTRMFNQYGWGGYLVERFYPQPDRRVFIFGEAELMGDSMLYRYNDLQTLRPDWRAILDRYRVDYVVFNHGAALSNVLLTQPDWKRVYSDGVADIFVRRQR
ncbi:MAG: hypothetical protein ACREPI_06330 [Candidatus Dormibacterales bacterium]